MAATAMDMKGDASSGPLLGLLSTDLVLEVMAFLNGPSLASLQCNRLLSVLAADRRQPAFLAVHGPLKESPDTVRERYPAAAPPNVGFLFANTSVHATSIAEALERMPPGLRLVGARCRFPLLGKDGDIVQGARLDSNSAVMSLITLPGVSHVRTFMPRQRDLAAAAAAPAPSASRRALLRQQLLGLEDDVEYSVVVLLSTGSDAQGLELVMGLIDERWPNAAVVGGIATSVFMWEGGRLVTSRDPGMSGVVGLALAGDVPLHAIVSRGVSPRSPRLSVVEHEYDEGEELLVVRSLRVPPSLDADGGDGDGQLLSPLNALYLFDVAGSGDLYVGLQEEREPHGQGSGPPAPFSLLNFDFAQERDQTVLLLQCKSKPRPGSRLAVKFFELESQACRADVEEKMRAVARELKQQNQELLGSLLFSCNGRGPTRFLDLQGAAAGIDARAFTAAFPGTPVAGFYCMGEIGPQSIWTEPSADTGSAAAQQQQQQRQRQRSSLSLAASQTGSTALQGFSAVFAALCVPKRRPNHGSHLMGVLHREGTAAALACVLGKGKAGVPTPASAGAGSMDT